MPEVASRTDMMPSEWQANITQAAFIITFELVYISFKVKSLLNNVKECSVLV